MSSALSHLPRDWRFWLLALALVAILAALVAPQAGGPSIRQPVSYVRSDSL